MADVEWFVWVSFPGRRNSGGGGVLDQYMDSTLYPVFKKRLYKVCQVEGIKKREQSVNKA
jgi:hypothetical protein